MKVRQDAWSEEDDLLLAETVLRHIREGGTQLRAFDEVGDALNRTSAACGFRWNAVVRDKYEDAIKLAKRHRKDRKRQMAQAAKPASFTSQPQAQSVYQPAPQVPIRQESTVSMSNNEMTLNDVILFLQNMNEKGRQDSLLKQENEGLKMENERMKEKVSDLEEKLAKLKEEHQTIEEDYQSIIQIMNRARRMAILEEDPEDRNAPAFKMDKNGNLEKIAK
ncbi:MULTISPECIES: RsfA family transcriptional regulator [Bacillaceae]|uniref:RsfA family transcriptional regulator n=1 Tax=Evansella alkalicola TaxID=745819 RepID=A0ABS6JQA2_9BACI|nr:MULTISPECIES: RsfA family transcriptional regulator [Bacillaceae]MBU9720678.1 RsfA family transcriptional regulator [Bacillus alkalicola]